MTGILVGLAIVVSSAGVSPALETPRATVELSALNFNLPAATAASATVPNRFQDDLSRTSWSASAPQTKPAKRLSRTDRIIAVAAGGAVGWILGGALGYRLTQSSKDDDGTSGLKGVVIGAPIGAAVGALFGFRMTK